MFVAKVEAHQSNQGHFGFRIRELEWWSGDMAARSDFSVNLLQIALSAPYFATLSGGKILRVLVPMYLP